MADPYSILGLARGASEKDVKSAYRKLAKELHPDRNAGKPNATERFSEVTRAYDLLSDKDKRARFDRGEIDIDGNPAMPPGFGGYGGGSGRGGFEGMGGAGMGGGGMGGGADGIDISEMFEGLFGGRAGAGMGGMGAGMGGGRPRAAPRGANIQYRLAVSLPDAATRAPQRITLGDGKTIDLKLPAGVEDGTQMRLPGKGEPSPGGGPSGAGDAIVTIQLSPHAFYRREGDNIRVDLPITLDEAVNGGKVKVPAPDGAVMLTVAPGSSSGKTLRLKNKGFTRKDGTRGDLLVSLEIDLPADDADALADLALRLDGWRDARNPRARLGV